jgi:hypothetical protein
VQFDKCIFYIISSGGYIKEDETVGRVQLTPTIAMKERQWLLSAWQRLNPEAHTYKRSVYITDI